MEAEILSAFARCEVHSGLSRALGDFQVHVPSLLAQARTRQRPAISNDLFFYSNVMDAQKTLRALRSFCESRRAGTGVSQAVRDLLAEVGSSRSRPLDPDTVPRWLEVYHPPAGRDDDTVTDFYRQACKDELRYAVQALDVALSHGDNRSWGQTVLLNHLKSRLLAFADFKDIEKGFGSGPDIREIAVARSMIGWLRERERLSLSLRFAETLAGGAGDPGALPRRLDQIAYQVQCGTLALQLEQGLEDGGMMRILMNCLLKKTRKFTLDPLARRRIEPEKLSFSLIYECINVMMQGREALREQKGHYEPADPFLYAQLERLACEMSQALAVPVALPQISFFAVSSSLR